VCACVYTCVCVCADQREATCFARFHAGRCEAPLIGNVLLKAECCCSVGAAWSDDDCQFCPRPHTGPSVCLSVSHAHIDRIITPHGTHYVRGCGAACCYRPSSVVCRSVCRPVTLVSPAKKAEPIEIPFGLRTREGPRNHVLDRGTHCKV